MWIQDLKIISYFSKDVKSIIESVEDVLNF